MRRWRRRGADGAEVALQLPLSLALKRKLRRQVLWAKVSTIAELSSPPPPPPVPLICKSAPALEILVAYFARFLGDSVE